MITTFGICPWFLGLKLRSLCLPIELSPLNPVFFFLLFVFVFSTPERGDEVHCIYKKLGVSLED